MATYQPKAVSKRPGSAEDAMRAQKPAPRDAGPLPEPVRGWVEEQPWAMVGAAAAIGVAVGAASRSTRLTGNLGQMISATASGAAVRVAINTLVQWLEPKLERK